MATSKHSLRLRPAVLLSPRDDGYLAYDVPADRLHHLNPAAALVVELFDGNRTLAEIEQDLKPLVGSDGWHDHVEWIYTAIRDGLLESVPETGNAASPPTARELATLARSLRSHGRVLAAFLCQQHAADLAPDDPDHWHALGELAHIVGRRDEARRAYARYAEAHPDDAEVEHILVSLGDTEPPPRAPDRCIEQLYARFASFYDESMCDDLGYCAPDRLAAAVEAALGDRTDLNILDLGCGTGLSGARFRSRARQLVGVDLSAAMIARARERDVYDGLHTAEITAWLAGANGDRHDVVIACDSLIYFGDLMQVLAPAARCLAPGGLVGFTVERCDTPPFRLTDSGRFAHHRDHVTTVASAAGLSVLSLDETVVRHEYGEPVVALVAVCYRSP